jgi:hypothetical protein
MNNITVSAPIQRTTFIEHAEEWYASMGWEVPPRGSDEWEKMYSEWSECIADF